jgi:hypothetical protein
MSGIMLITMLASVLFLGGNFLQVLNLKNMNSTARKKFGEKMNLIHHISKYMYFKLPDIYNKFHQVTKYNTPNYQLL